MISRRQTARARIQNSYLVAPVSTDVRGGGGGPASQVNPWRALLAVLLLLGIGVPWAGESAPAQDDPPPFGDGAWVVTTPTVLKDTVVRLNGNLTITSTGSLTLDNATLLLHRLVERRSCDPVFDPARVQMLWIRGGTLRLIRGSMLSAFDQKYWAKAEFGSTIEIRDSTVSHLIGFVVEAGTLTIENSTVRDVDWGFAGLAGGTARVANSTFEGSGIGLYFSGGTADVLDNTFNGGSQGIALGGSTPPFWVTYFQTLPCSDGWGNGGSAALVRIRRNSIDRMSAWGIRGTGLPGSEILNNTVRDSVVGLWVGGGGMVVGGSTILNCSYGLITGANTLLIDGRINGSTSETLTVDTSAPSTVTWQVRGAAAVDGRVYWAGNIDVLPGGSLDLDRVGWHHVSTRQSRMTVGGGLNVRNSTFDRLDLNVPAPTVVVDPTASVDISGSRFTGYGLGWGAAGEDAGWFIGSSDTIIRESQFEAGMYGLVIAASGVVLEDLTLASNINGMVVSGATASLRRSSITSTAFDLDLRSAEVDSYSSSFARARVTASSDSALRVWWDLAADVAWQTGTPVSAPSVSLYDIGGTERANVTGDANGTLPPLELVEYELRGSILDARAPYRAQARFPATGNTNNTTVDLSRDTGVRLYLEDSTPPDLTVAAPTERQGVPPGPVTFNGTVHDTEAGFRDLRWSVDRVHWNSVPVNGSSGGAWNLTVNLTAGTRPVYFRARDLARNVVDVRRTVLVDDLAPFLFILRPADGTRTRARDITIEGLTEPGVTITAGSVSFIATEGRFLVTVPLTEGPNTFLIEALDPAGNRNQTSRTIVRDTTAPPLVVTEPADGQAVPRPAVTLRGSTEPGALVTVEAWGTPHLVDTADGTFKLLVALRDGENLVNITAQDDLGNVNHTSIRVTRDEVAPWINITEPAPNTVLAAESVTVRGVTEAGARVTANVAGTEITVEPSGYFRAVVPLITDGPVQIRMTAFDAAGNNASRSLIVDRDLSVPPLRIDEPLNGSSTDQRKVFLKGTSEAGTVVLVAGRAVPVGVSGDFSTFVATHVGTNRIDVVSIDAAGNRANLTLILIGTGPPPPNRKQEQEQATRAASFVFGLIALAAIEIAAVWYVSRRYMQRRRDAASRAAADRLADDMPAETEEGGGRDDA